MTGRETAATMRAVLDALPPNQRRAVMLRYYEGLDTRDLKMMKAGAVS